MNDLLSESFEIPHGSGNGDIELGSYLRTSGELNLDTFFKKVQELDGQFEKLGKLFRQLQDAHEESKTVTKALAMKGGTFFQ